MSKIRKVAVVTLAVAAAAALSFTLFFAYLLIEVSVNLLEILESASN